MSLRKMFLQKSTFFVPYAFFNRKRKMRGRLNRSDGLLVYFKP